jgi:cytoskeletal protein CcmA (bactofilin family)
MNTWYDSSVNSNILRKTYVNGFLDVSQNVSTRRNLYVNGDTSLNSDLYVNGEIHANDIYRMGGHILPTSNANYDIGSAEYKVRHLFLSDNSLWVGDNHKIDVDEGKLKFRKRNVSKIPKALSERGTDLEQIKDVLGIPELTIENISLGQYQHYARKSGLVFNNKTGDAISLEDIYTKDVDDYEDIQDAEITKQDLSLNYNLYANGDVSFNSKMFVKGDVSFNSRVDVNGEFRAKYPDNSIPISAIVGDNENKADKDLVDASFNLKADINNATFTGTPTAPTADSGDDSTQIATTAFVTDAVSNGGLDPNNDLNLNAGLSVEGDVSFNNNVSMYGDVDISGSLTVKNQSNTTIINTTVNEYTSIVTEDISLNGKLSVSGDVSLNGDVDITGQIIVGNSISTQGTVSSQSYNIGNINVISGNRGISCSALDIQNSNGDSNFISYGDTGNTTIKGELYVDKIKETTLSTGVTIESVILKDGNINSAEIASSGTVSSQSYNIGNINVISGNRGISCSALDIQNSNGDSNFISYGATGNTTIQGELEVNNDVSFNNGLSVEGDVSFNSNVDIDGQFAIRDDKTKWRKIGMTLPADSNSLVNSTSVKNVNGIPYVAYGAYHADDENVGVTENLSNTGKVRVFKYVNGGFTQVGQNINGKVSDETGGHSISLSDDATLLAVGFPYLTYYGTVENPECVRVYEYNASVDEWQQLGNDIVKPYSVSDWGGGANRTEFGCSVSLVKNNTNEIIVAVGLKLASNTNHSNHVGSDNNTNSSAGAVAVFKRNAGNTTVPPIGWEQYGEVIFSQSNNAADQYFGSSVSLTNEGRTLAVGAPYWNNYQGFVEVWDYNSAITPKWVVRGGSTNQAKWLLKQTSSIVNNQVFGTSVQLSSDGDKIIIGAPSMYVGFVEIYTYDATNGWEIKGSRISQPNGDGDAKDSFGLSVAMNDECDTIVIGCPHNDVNNSEMGFISIYNYDDTNTNDWVEYQTIREEYNNSGLPRFGIAVSMSLDGKYISAVSQRGTQANHLQDTSISTYLGGFCQLFTQDVPTFQVTDKVVGIQSNMFINNSLEVENTLTARGQTMMGYADIESLTTRGANFNGTSTFASGNVNMNTYAKFNTDVSFLTGNITEFDSNVICNGDVSFNSTGRVDICGNFQAQYMNQSIPISAINPNDDFNLNANLSITGELTVPNRINVGTLINSVANNAPQLGSDIEGTGAMDQFGHSVSLSSDGSIVAIGAAAPNSTGQVRVYQRDTNAAIGWTQLGGNIDGEVTGDQFGYSVSLSADGYTVAIGAIGNDGTYPGSGHVRVYRYDSNKTSAIIDQNDPNFGPAGWNRLGQDIDGEAQFDNSAVSVSLNANGNIVAIGAARNSNRKGHVRVYQYDSNKTSAIIDQNDPNFGPAGWNRLGKDIDGEAKYNESGHSVSLNANGNIVAIGAYGNSDNGAGGHVRVYQYDSNKTTAVTDQDDPYFGPIGWNRLGQDIDGEVSADGSGYSVSLSADGYIVAIGAWRNDGNTDDSNDNRGHVRVYQRNANKTTAVTDQNDPYFGPAGWYRLGQDIDGDASGDYSGYSVSLSSDGSIVAIGAYKNDGNSGQGDDDRGHVRVYKYDYLNSNWDLTFPEIDGKAAGGEFGHSVSLSSDGSVVAIGAPYTYDHESSYSGFVQVYQKPTASHTLVLRDISFNGIPTAPTALSGTNTTQIATTAFVTDAVNNGGLDPDSDLNLNAGLSVGGDVSFNSKLFVNGDISLNGGLFIPDKSINVAALKNNSDTTNKTFVITAGGGVYSIDGVTQDTLLLYRGLKYVFDVNDSSIGSHPFYIQTTSGTYTSSNVYNEGVTNNGATSGTIEFIIPDDAPNTLYYVCGSHSGMGGTINIQNGLNINDKLFVSETIEHNGLTMTPGTGIDQIIEFTNAPTFTANEWFDLHDGSNYSGPYIKYDGSTATSNVAYPSTYIMQLYIQSSGNFDLHASGNITFGNNPTSSTDGNTEEIVLHRGYYKKANVWARMKYVTTGSVNEVRMQIKVDTSVSSLDTYKLTLRRFM